MQSERISDFTRRRIELRRSLEHTHPENEELSEKGFDEWARGLPQEDVEALVHSSGGKPVRWIPGEGWIEGPE